MIYGVQWDAVCDWLEQSGFNTDTDSSSWGNYNSGSKIDTGSNSTYEANGIFDLAGNCREWTQEADSTSSRIRRGGNCNASGSSDPASDRSSYSPRFSSSVVSSRATLYMS